MDFVLLTFFGGMVLQFGNVLLLSWLRSRRNMTTLRHEMGSELYSRARKAWEKVALFWQAMKELWLRARIVATMSFVSGLPLAVLGVANDLSAYVSNVPIANVTGISYAIFFLKAILELPLAILACARARAFILVALWLLAKPGLYLLPIIGFVFDSVISFVLLRRVWIRQKQVMLDRVSI